MNYNNKLDSFNDRLEALLGTVYTISPSFPEISFKGETEKNLHIDIERPNKVLMTTNPYLDGDIHQLPATMVKSATEMGIARHKDRIYLLGGWTRENTPNTLNTLSYYDLNSHQIYEVADVFPMNVSGAMMIEYSNALYIIGGYGTGFGIIRTIYKYDLLSETLSTTNMSLPVGLTNPVPILNEQTGILYIVAGAQKPADKFLAYDNILKIDLINGQVSTLDKSIAYPSYYCGHSIVGSRIYLFGGKAHEDDSNMNHIQWFDSNDESTGVMNTTLLDNGRVMTAQTIDDTIYLFGGVYPDGKYKSSIYTYRPASDDGITFVDRMLPWPSKYAASIKVDKSIYHFGGQGNEGYHGATRCAFVYTPYQENTCVAVMKSNNDSFELLKSNTGLDITSAIDYVKYATDGTSTTVNYTVENATPTKEDSIYNFGSTKRKLPGYIYSPNFTQTPSNVVTTAQCEYFEKHEKLTAALKESGTVQCAVRYEDRIYIFGGWTSDPVSGSTAATNRVINTISRFDIATETLTVLTEKLDIDISGLAGALIGNKIYLAGGWATSLGGGCSDVRVFDPVTEKMLEKANFSLPIKVFNAAVGVWSDRMYIVGGRNDDGTLNTIIEVDPAAQKATMLPATLPQGVYYAGYAQSGDKLYVVGGLYGSAWQSCAQYFDYSTFTTGSFANLPTVMQGPTCTVIDEYLYMMGGVSAKSGTYKYFYQYNLMTNKIVDCETKISTTCELGTNALIDNRLYAFGGQARSLVDNIVTSKFTNEIYKYTFTPVVPYNTYLFHTSKEGQRCTPYKAAGVTIEVPVDKVYVGDYKDVGISVDNVEVFLDKKWVAI